ncbi:hypothetical protein B0H14DRAFT_3519188 [Mycena olivaceomarginata]|nr:hypothetical protein B0H14DRAFT_3519188 [Mycena olivaceomarginata]
MTYLAPTLAGLVQSARCRCLFEPERSFWRARIPTISGFCCRSRTEITEMHVALPLDRHGEFLYAPACRRLEPQMIGSVPIHKSSTTRARPAHRTSRRTRAAPNTLVRFCCVQTFGPAAQLATGRVYIFRLGCTRTRRSRATGLSLLLILLLPATTKSRHRSSRPSPYASFLRVPRIRRSRICGLAYLEHDPVPPNCTVTIVTYTLNTVRYDYSITLMLTQRRHSLVFPTAHLERAHGTADPVRLCPIPLCVRTEIPPRPLFCTSLLLLPNLAGVPRDPAAADGRARRTEGIEGIASRPPPIPVAPRAPPPPVAVYVKPPIVTHPRGLRASCRYIQHSHVHTGSTLHLLDSEQGASPESFCHTFYGPPSARADATHPRTQELRARHANAPLLI